MQANPVGNLGRSTAAPELPGASHGDGPWYRYCKGYCGSRAWERKKRYLTSTLRPYRGDSLLSSQHDFLKSLDRDAEPQASRARAFEVDSATAAQPIFRRELPALHKTLHSPLFYHTEPAPQQKFAATRPARGCTLIAPKNKINVTLIGLALDPVRVTVTPPPGLRNVEVSTEF